MKITQLQDLVNTVSTEVLGKEAVVNEDLSNVTDIGKQIIDADQIDNYVKKLVDHIGQVIFSARVYNGSVPSVMLDSWEFGSILEKIDADMPEAEENDSWNLKDGQSYDQDVFYQPKVSAKFFNSKITFDIPLSFTEQQVKSSFDNVNQLNGFISMLETSVQNSMTVKVDSLVMRTINSMTAQTLSTKNGVVAVNLLDGFNKETGNTLAAKDAPTNKEFIKYASYIMSLYSDRITKMSSLFNLGGKDRFTPTEQLHFVLLSDFAKASSVYLESDTIHNDLVKLPNFETVPYWQASGKSYNFDDVSSIDVKVTNPDDNTKPITVSQNGIIGVMFDTNALGVANLNQRVTTNFNARAEFYTNWYKFDAGFYTDLNENFIVFYLADPTTAASGK